MHFGSPNLITRNPYLLHLQFPPHTYHHTHHIFHIHNWLKIHYNWLQFWNSKILPEIDLQCRLLLCVMSLLCSFPVPTYLAAVEIHPLLPLPWRTTATASSTVPFSLCSHPKVGHPNPSFSTSDPSLLLHLLCSDFSLSLPLLYCVLLGIVERMLVFSSQCSTNCSPTTLSFPLQ